DLGGAILNSEEVSRFVLHYTLNLWQSSYASGVYAANNLGKKGAIVASMYDGGYHMTPAFSSAFEKNGGTISSFYVSPLDYKSESFGTMVDEIKHTNPDFIYVLFSFKEGSKVLETLAKSSIHSKTPILASPMATATHHTSGLELHNMLSIASWSFDASSMPMQSFVDQLKKKYDQQPTVFALLGYEIGKVVAEYIASDKTEDGFSAILNGKHIEMPRGSVYFDDRNESMIAEFVVRNWINTDGSYRNVVKEKIKLHFDQETYQDLEQLPTVSWQNPYTCT
ncbi:MAG: ABC transporter substrate-binding protein, partial [Marinirhabdus sp.]|nr:ABC transporter substrate-binding protein [Marinirhabdus sp.]